MERILIIIFISLLVNQTYSQNTKPSVGEGIVSGKVLDKNNDQPIEYGSFRLFSVKDSSLVAGVFTDASGKFLLENLPFGNYFGKFTYAGYLTRQFDDIKISQTMKVANLGTIKIDIEKAGNLKEIKVTGQLDVLKAGIDKKVYNVAEDLSVKGGTANDILNNIPSVEVDQDGRVMLRGEGTVTVLIDGRPSSLSGGNGKSLLDALPAGSIERIEVVTNPSAKYDPDGTSGIINIVLKKNKLRGFNGLITTNLGSGDLKGGNVVDGTASLSYRNSKLNLYGSYSARYMNGYRNNYSDLEQTFSDGSVTKITQNRVGTDENSGNTFRLGSDFYLKARHILGVSMTGNIGERNRTGEQWNSKYDGNDNLLALWKRDSDDPTKQKNFDFNVNYKYDLKNDRGNLVVDLNQSIGNERILGNYYQNDYSADSVLLGSQALQQYLNNNEKNNITTGQIDFTYLFPKINARLETGAKAIIRQQSVNTYSESMDTLLGYVKEDTLANFNYAYDEEVYSVYGIFGQQLGKFKYQAGVRFEQAYQIPNLISDSLRIVNNYFNIFPSGHIRYSLGGKSEVSLSYSRRINRAASADLNPFTSYADPYNLRKGNPNLQPEFIDSYDLGYTNEIKKVNFTTSIFYRHTTGVITRVKEFYADNTSAVTFANIDQSHSAGAEAVFIVKPFKWWRNNLSFNANFTKYVDDNPTSNWNVGGFNWNLKYSTTIDFWKRTASIQINAAYNAPRVTIQGTAQRRGPIDLSFEKTFNEGKISLGMRVSDIFNKQGFYMQIDQENIRQYSEFKWLTRRYFLTFTYKFGKLEMTNRKSSGGEGGFEM